MMDNPAKQQYEGAILQQLIKNSERLVIMETQVSKIDGLERKIDGLEEKFDRLEEKVEYVYQAIKWIVGLLVAVLVAVLANLLSQPILSILG